MMKRWMILLAALLLTACQAPVLVPQGQNLVRDRVQVQVDQPWSAFRSGNLEVWTQDGPMLQSLGFHVAIDDGSPIYSGVRTGADDALPKFNKSMSIPEIMELHTASLTKLARAPVSVSGLRPLRFAGADGFRFDYALTGEDEVARKGIVVGAVVANRLYMIDYRGAALHYFEKARPMAEAIMASAILRSAAD